MNKINPDRKTIIKLIFLVAILITITIAGIRIAPWLIEHAKDPQYIRDYLNGYGKTGFLVYVLMQIIQVVIAIIPADIISICGGYVYGIPFGGILTFTGIMLGSVIVFYISRIFGYEFVSGFIAKEKIDKLSGILNSTKGMIGLFIICSIPVIPKDILIYVAGLTPVKAYRLFLVYGLSRIPATFIWVSIGANAYKNNMTGIMLNIAVLIIMLAILWLLSRFYNKKRAKN